MFTYVQATGNLYRDGIFVAAGYSGIGNYRNIPQAQRYNAAGPIPVGIYDLRPVIDTRGNFIAAATYDAPVFTLEPDGITQTFERRGFTLSGPSLVNRSRDINKVVIDSYDVRKAIAAAALAGDTTFVVVAGESDRAKVAQGGK